jgi:putative phosphoesterase
MKDGEKIAVISDIHGNKWALKEVINDIKERNIDTIFNLGDSLYGPLDPVSTYDILKKNKIINISGNEDRIILENVKKNTDNKTLKYILNVIDDEIIGWIGSLHKTMIIDELFLCHGTPNKDDMYLIEKVTEQGVFVKNNDELYTKIKGISQKIICCGHSHKFNLVNLKSGQFIVNPGSVGLQAYNDDVPIYHKIETGSNKASYCMIKKERNQYVFSRILVSYDWKSASRYALKNNHKEWAKWLISGKV